MRFYSVVPDSFSTALKKSLCDSIQLCTRTSYSVFALRTGGSALTARAFPRSVQTPPSSSAHFQQRYHRQTSQRQWSLKRLSWPHLLRRQLRCPQPWDRRHCRQCRSLLSKHQLNGLSQATPRLQIRSQTRRGMAFEIILTIRIVLQGLDVTGGKDARG